MTHYADPKNDLAFKKIFGDPKHKSTLIHFLNAVLGYVGERLIRDVDILSPYQVPQLDVLKNSLLDVKAIDQSGREFIVEMQVERDIHFAKRSQYYTAKSYVSQIKTGEEYAQLKEVVFLGILDFIAFDGSEPITRHISINQHTGTQDLLDFDFNFIELPKFKKPESQLATETDFWIDFFKSAVNREQPPAHLPKNLVEAYDNAAQYKWSRVERDAYDSHAMRVGVLRNVQQQAIEAAVKAAEKAAEARGEAKGKAEGKAEAKAEMIKALYAGGMSAERIAAISGETLAVVSAIIH